MNKPAPPNPPAPFSCTYTPNVPELLQQLRCTIALSTYQAGKVVLLSSVDGERLIQLPRSFKKPMGIALKGPQMAIATQDEVHLLTNSPGLAAHYPSKPGTYDALFMPRATFYTGQIDIHDLEWGDDGLYAVNTSFSCICKIDEHFSFTPVWKPSFVSQLSHEDRCHLNGMAMQNGHPRYATAFNQGDTRQSWRENITKTGVVIDIESGEALLEGLAMPHSPRLYDGQLYVLLSATGELIRVAPEDGSYDVVARLNSFVRGLGRCGDYAFIGLSRLRANSSTFAKLPMEHQARQAGIAIVHLPTGATVGQIRYQTSVDEIYDILILPGLQRPNLLNTEQEAHKLGLSIPEKTYWARPETE
ncbi:MAG: TIGR03032 family protein [Phaeodactylibacter sp.]|uniref:TIGR03032 family protein n=1 Tax=Phaeodactylibacter sp. TaxID=1940289 RepID=UPI0032F05FDC